jgi:outer membrane protein
MKTAFIASILVLFSLPIMAAKVAKVDVQRVLVTVNEGKAVRSTLKKKFDAKQVIIKKEENKIRKLQKDFQKQSAIMSAKAKIKKEKEIQNKIIALQQKTMTFQKEIQDQEGRLKKPILEKVRKVIDKLAKSGGYDMVFEVTTSPIYIKEFTDITDKVVKAFNKTK